MDDRRRAPRLAAAWPSSIVTDDAILVGRTVDVSEYGVCVVTAPTTALKAGNSYRIELVGASGSAISTVAEVRHVSAHGIGLRTRDRLLSPGVVVPRSTAGRVPLPPTPSADLW